jgi:MFS family permease
MLAVFWFGGGSCMILTGLAATPWQLVAAMTVMGMFAAIYHPVGTAMLISVAGASGRALGLNGVFGNLGVASAPLVTGLILDVGLALGLRTAGPGDDRLRPCLSDRRSPRVPQHPAAVPQARPGPPAHSICGSSSSSWG